MRRILTACFAALVCGLPVLISGSPSTARAQPSRAAQSVPAAGTLVLRGSMASTATLTLTGALSVGRATNLSWELPLPTSINLNGYAQSVLSTTFTFNTPPDSQSDLRVGANMTRRFHWDSPPPDAPLTVVETLRVRAVVRLNPFASSSPYPLTQAAVPDAVSAYARPTALTTLPASARPVAVRLARGAASEAVVVTRVANWVAERLRSRDTGAADPASALRTRRASAAGFSDVMAAFLRFLRIPVQFEFGWLSARPLYFPPAPDAPPLPVWTFPHGVDQAHGWINVYFPGSGWVPFDPEAEKFFVDTRHFGLFTNVDAGEPVDSSGAHWFGRWSAIPESPGSATGKPLPGGQTEIVPGDGIASKVAISGSDTFHVHLSAFRADVRNAQLYAR